jgi:hypothetical protein
VNPLVIFAPLAELVLDCVLLGPWLVCVADPLFVVLVVIPVEVVVELAVDEVELEAAELVELVTFTVELGAAIPSALSVKPQAGAPGPSVSHTPITHLTAIGTSVHVVPVSTGARSSK